MRARDSSRACTLCAFIFLAVAIFPATAICQGVPDVPNSDNPALPAPDNANDPPQLLPASSPLVTLHGVVKNAATGEPLPRTLVQVGGETGPAALTDGDGRFEFTVPGAGSQVVQITKPGFHDVPLNTFGPAVQIESSNTVPHNVVVADGMPPLSFALMPASAILGHIDLSTGDPAQGIGVLLLRRTLQSGHAIWRSTSNTRTNSDGAYRFGGLDDGDYAIATESAKDAETTGNFVEPSSEAKVTWSGYAATYYPNAREFSGAARIHLRAGETVQANFALKLEPFHLVRATLAPVNVSDKSVVDYGASLTDSQGHSLSYPAQYDADTRTVQAMLPDGSYTLQVTALNRRDLGIITHANKASGVVLQGTTDFTVAGRPITSLRIALAQKESNPIVVSVNHGSAQPTSNFGGRGGVFISVSQAGDTLIDGMWTQFAQGAVPGPLQTNVLAPGSYWVHTAIAQQGFCESSFTAGGASLAREPLVVGAGGASAPMALTLRDDCATLKLSLPTSLISPTVAEEPAFTIYVVPDFDSTVDVAPLTIRPSSGGSLTLDNLTPGKYHVYTFTASVELEYRNPDALAALPNPGQLVTLDPSSTSTLVLETPAQ